MRTVGGRGDGPGEFRNVITAGWVADTLWVLDGNGYRFSQFDATGEYLGSFSVPFEMGAGIDTPNPPRADGLLFDGTVRGSTPAFSVQIANGTLTHAELMLMTRDGQVTDTVARIPWGPSVWAISDPDEPGRGGSYRQQPFGDGPLWSFVPGQRALVVLDRSAPAEAGRARYTLTKLALGGDTLFTRSHAAEAIPVTDAEVDSVVTTLVEQMTASPFFKEMGAGELREWATHGLYVPAFRPAAAGLQMGRDGAIWVRETTVEADVQRWLVHDAEGEPVGRVVLPSSVVLMAADAEHVWGGDRDEMDVPYLVRYRLVRPD